MQMELQFAGTQIDKTRGVAYPVCSIGDVNLHFNHYDNFEQAKEIWNTRKKRISYKNILAKMNIDTEEKLEEFRKIPCRKIGFSLIPANDEEIIDCSDMIKFIQGKYQNRFWEFVNWQARNEAIDLKLYYVLKLLLGKQDYKRTF